MRLPPAFVLAALMTLAAAVPASAQTHEHGAGGAVVIAHDVPADGTTFVGTPNHFAVIVKGDDVVPDFHNNIHIRVVLNGQVLYETTPDSGHDYDGVNTFDVTFPATGSYSVQALDPEDDSKMVAMFDGHVLPAPGASAPHAELVVTHVATTPTEQIMAGEPVHFTVDLLDGPASAGGARMDHTDTWFEAWKDGRLEFRTKLHTHEELQELDYAFQESGTYTVRVTGFQAYPTAKSQDSFFAPVVHEEQLMVLPGVPVNGVDDGKSPMPQAALNAVVMGKSGGAYQLLGTFDPYTVVGPDTLQHLDALVVNTTTGQTIQHVNFEATLKGPAGILFHSQTLHEYDGIYELTTRQELPGAYMLDVMAKKGDWSDDIQMGYFVVPPVVAVPTVASDVGPVMFSLKAPDLTAGTAGDFLLHGADIAGEPFAHNEVEFRLFGPGADPATSTPIASGKWHTHDDGDYGFKLAFPQPGTYKLELSPTPLMANPVLLKAQSFDIKVGAGPGFPDQTSGLDANASADKAAPALAPMVLVAALAVVVVALRRRT